MDKIVMNRTRITTSPGELLRVVIIPGLVNEKIIPNLGADIEILAGMLGVETATLQAVVDEKSPITADLALRLGKLLDKTPEFWMSMQASHDLSAAWSEKKKEYDKISQIYP